MYEKRALQFKGVSLFFWAQIRRAFAGMIEEVVGLLEADEAKMIANGAMKRGKYRTPDRAV